MSNGARSWSGFVVNAEGETLYLDNFGPDNTEYKHSEEENTMEVFGTKSEGTRRWYTVKYSDNFKVTSYTDRLSFTCNYDLSYPLARMDITVECTGAVGAEAVFEGLGEKITVHGDGIDYTIANVPLYYYRADVDVNYWDNMPYVFAFTLEGKTDGNVTLEKKEDGWYLSGADGELALTVWHDPEQAPDPESNPDYYYTIPLEVSPGEVIHIEEHIPEVQELYK